MQPHFQIVTNSVQHCVPPDRREVVFSDVEGTVVGELSRWTE
ncbi:MAG: hypothetical protein ACKO7R_04130 [Pseudanabaena sp.]